MNSVSQVGSSSHVLVKCAKSEHTGENAVELTVYADLVKIKALPQPTKNKRPQSGSGRKSITRFTRKSRKNMIERLAMMRTVEKAQFVTLTYGGKFDFDERQVKTHLHNFYTALFRRYPDAGMIWRLELKRRKSGESVGQLVPHFHLLVVNVDARWQPLLRQFIRHTWTRIVTGSDAGDLLRTQAEIVFSRRHAAAYVAKYAAKDEDDIEEDLTIQQNSNDTTSQSWGRRWGACGNLDLSPALVIEMPVQALVEVKRLLRSWLKSRGSNYHYRLRRGSMWHGCSVFGLGDLSNLIRPGIENATITRMIIAASV